MPFVHSRIVFCSNGALESHNYRVSWVSPTLVSTMPSFVCRVCTSVCMSQLVKLTQLVTRITCHVYLLSFPILSPLPTVRPRLSHANRGGGKGWLLETQDERAATLCHLSIDTSLTLAQQCFTFTEYLRISNRLVYSIPRHYDTNGLRPLDHGTAALQCCKCHLWKQLW